MIPLQENVKITHIAFKNVRLELREANSQSSRQFLESVHYSVLHRSRVLLSGIEGEAMAGQVKWNHMIIDVNPFVDFGSLGRLRLW